MLVDLLTVRVQMSGSAATKRRGSSHRMIRFGRASTLIATTDKALPRQRNARPTARLANIANNGGRHRRFWQRLGSYLGTLETRAVVPFLPQAVRMVGGKQR